MSVYRKSCMLCLPVRGDGFLFIQKLSVNLRQKDNFVFLQERLNCPVSIKISMYCNDSVQVKNQSRTRS